MRREQSSSHGEKRVWLSSFEGVTRASDVALSLTAFPVT